MPDYFDTREGWREVTHAEWPYHDGHEDYVIVKIDGARRFFVRSEPVPPLPTDRYTVIRVSQNDSGTNALWILYDDWSLLDGNNVLTADQLHDAITGFEIVSKP